MHQSELKKWLILVVCILPLTLGQLCSTVCSPGMCSGPLSTQCNTGCPTDWTFSGSTCSIDPSSEYVLIGSSSDLSYTTVATITPSTTDTCGSYTFYGVKKCKSDTFTINISSGIGIPHYSYKVALWVILTNSSSWIPSDNISISDGSISQTYSLASPSGQEVACNNDTQSYFRLQWSQTHINQTSTAISLIVSTDINGGNCRWGLKEVVVIAQNCESSCLTCNGPSNTECYSCANGYYLGNNTCYTACPSGYGQSSTLNQCITCDVLCVDCYGVTTNCSACVTSAPNEAFLTGSTCSATCANTTFANSSTHTCDSCPSNCDVCSSASICTACASGYGLLNNTCYSPCPSSYWFQNGTHCTSCDPKCTTCTSSADSSCSECTLTGANMAYLDGATCVASCPNTTYSSTSPNMCNNCHAYCASCTGPSASQCSSCTTSGTDEAFLTSSTTCTQSCPTATFADTSTHVCESCPSNCDVCSSASLCTTCASGYGLLNNTCHNPCPSGYYLNGAVCSGCDSKCSDCTGPSASQCSSCAPSNWLSGTTCDSACLTSYGQSSTTGECISCDSNCLSCSLVSSNCSSCVTSGADQAFLDNTNTPNTQCVDVNSCPGSTFPDTGTHTCSGCDPSCYTCSTLATNCTSCTGAAGLLNNVCHTPCPATYFLDTGNICLICDTLCSTCSGSSTNCSECETTSPNTAYLLNNTCMVNCPSTGYYEDNNTGAGPNVCSTCHSYCSECYLGGQNQCTVCAATYTLSGSTCDSNCLSGYGYYSGTPQICIVCTYPCLTCYESATNCSTCNTTQATHYLWQSSPSSFQCVTICPAPLMENDTTLTCDSCPTGCQDCNSSTYCYSCNTTAGYGWINTTYLCYDPCPVYYFKENDTNCSLCNAECRHCQDVPYNCTECQTVGEYKSFLLGNTCFFVCPSGFYGDNATDTCQSCDPSCSLCFNSSKNDCYWCQNGYLLSGYTCDLNCTGDYFLDSNIPFVCQLCNATCLNCSGNSTNCSICINTTYLHTVDSTYSECLQICPDGYFPNDTTKACQPCDSKCAICLNSSTNCSDCVAGYAISGSECVSGCPSHEFYNGASCSNCHSSCQNCQGVNTNCTSCYNGTYLFNNTCVGTCPTGYYESTNNGSAPNKCNQCQNECGDCDIKAWNCTSCASGYYWSTGDCVSPCPTGYYPNATGYCSNSLSLTTQLTVDMYFIANDEAIYVDMVFTKDMDQATFDMEGFQSFTFSQSFSNGQMNFSYQWINSTSYRVTIQPSGYLLIERCKVEVTTMNQPATNLTSQDGSALFSTCYQQTASLTWSYISIPGKSQMAKATINTMSQASDSIGGVTTIPYLQQLNKAGLACLLLPGMQITASIIVVNEMYSEQTYEASRFFANFIYFQVPKWQKQGNKSKYVITTPVEEAMNNRRLNIEDRLMADSTTDIGWRYQRVGFTSVFLFDCYLQLCLLAFSWLLLLIGYFLHKQRGWSIMQKIYSIFHALHEIMIFYFAIGLVLELMYLEVTSALRVFSLLVAFAANFYLLIYTLKIYYAMIQYPQLQLGSPALRETMIKYGYFIRNMRHEEYEEDEKWTPRQLFRPYNYHILSYYKKVLMIISVPLFYPYPTAEMGVLMFLQILEMARLWKSWPYAQKWRNYLRLFLQVVLLLFFMTGLIQCISLSEMRKNDPDTIESSVNTFEVSGWIGVSTIFFFNLSCMGLVLLNFFQDCCTSNRQNIREIRKEYYYNKVIKFEHSFENDISKQKLDTWVARGDLNDKWIDDEDNHLKPITVTVEKYTINIMGDSFLLEVDKIQEMTMGTAELEDMRRKIKVGSKLKGTVSVRKDQNILLFKIIQSLFEQYDPSRNADYLLLKTFATIDPNIHTQGELIKVESQKLTQDLQIKIPFKDTAHHIIDTPFQGFPLSNQLLKTALESNCDQTI